MSPDLAADYHQVLDPIERRHWWFVALREFVVATVTSRMVEGSRVLDIGCSTGHVIAALPEEYKRTGIDVSPGAIDLARAIRPAIPFVNASVEELPFESGSFDCAFALDVLSMRGVDNRAALREIRRVLRPGGVFLVQVPAYEWLKSDYDYAVGTAHRYTAGSLRSLLQTEGFGMERLTYRVTTLFPLAATRRLLARCAETRDLRVPSRTLNRLFAGITRLEDRVARRRRLPFGLSVFAVAAVPQGGRGGPTV
jgi:ubiquinone/menaquinone biosynthesis C-methylase UbiE